MIFAVVLIGNVKTPPIAMILCVNQCKRQENTFFCIPSPNQFAARMCAGEDEPPIAKSEPKPVKTTAHDYRTILLHPLDPRVVPLGGKQGKNDPAPAKSEAKSDNKKELGRKISVSLLLNVVITIRKRFLGS